jgi:hypothetical protein
MDLIDFIENITYGTRIMIDEEGQKYEEDYIGERCMIDMFNMVKDSFWGKEMKGSNSIKYVLPAVLNASATVQKLYSEPIYGKDKKIKSLNFDEMSWIEKDENGNVTNPYKLLPTLNILDDSSINNGADAMTAYTKLQFMDVSEKERKDMRDALLRYCELDTLAMVMIMQYWLATLPEEDIYYIHESGVTEIYRD